MSLGWDLIQWAYCPYKRVNLETDTGTKGKYQHENKDRDLQAQEF